MVWLIDLFKQSSTSDETSFWQKYIHLHLKAILLNSSGENKIAPQRESIKIIWNNMYIQLKYLEALNIFFWEHILRKYTLYDFNYVIFENTQI